ncbi:redox-regulated ATPase YchF [Patescibacteria group bacterium]|nr:redox-regulated ATPase YchF [Patescibacteria group bacterium]
MALSVGIVGLPNVGKSTLFQALTKKKVDIANYPFSTVEPNVGIVKVPDERLEKIAEIFSSQQSFPTIIEFVDIAGLVKDAHKGEGLGNQFLSHIRETDGIVHLLRSFEHSEVAHVEAEIDPVRDIDTVQTELLLKDQETVQKRVYALEKDVRAGKKEAVVQNEFLPLLLRELNTGNTVLYFFKKNPKAKEVLQDLQLLTAKPVMYLVNSNTDKIPSALSARLKGLKTPFVVMNAREELEIAGLSSEEANELGVKPKLPEVIEKCYELLDLITFFTGNQNETRAWTLEKGASVSEAAGRVHSDFQENFIRALIIPWDKLAEAGSLQEATAKGQIRTEGKDYVVKDGDVIEIKHA